MGRADEGGGQKFASGRNSGPRWIAGKMRERRHEERMALYRAALDNSFGMKHDALIDVAKMTLGEVREFLV